MTFHSVEIDVSRTGFVMSMLLCILGVVLLAFGLLVQALLPIFALLIWEGGGPYGAADYKPGAWIYVYDVVAILCICWGVGWSKRFSNGTSDETP